MRAGPYRGPLLQVFLGGPPGSEGRGIQSEGRVVQRALVTDVGQEVRTGAYRVKGCTHRATEALWL